jgi:D-glycero-D-manno-heptose 1,7-bisphosphate phosphatase
VSGGGRGAVFVDRDGTLMVERYYLADPDGVRLVPGSVKALSALREAGFALVVVTNQSGLARGLYSLDDYRAVARRLDQLLSDAGAPVDATYYCPHHPDVTGPCDCRKPDTGMYVRAATELGLDLADSWYVGDKVTDVLPAGSLGGRGIMVRTGYGREQEGDAPPGVAVVDDLAAAASLILADQRSRAVDPPEGPG